MSIKYHIICPNCGHEFNIDYSEWNSLSDPEVGIIFRYGSNTFSCKCPQCHKRSRYHVTDSNEVATETKEDK